MDDQKVSFSIKSYKDNEHVRILNSVLSKWLANPKILHFTAPKIQYPYKINNWISTSYNDENTHTYTIEIDNWIIGHLSAKLNNETNSAHLFHLIIDENHRKKGFAKKLIDHVEKKLVTENNINCITLNCVKKNEQAINLYQSIGYNIIKEKKYLKMNKYF